MYQFQNVAEMFSTLLPSLKDKLIVLASGSPRRKEIISKLGFPYEVIPSKFAEDLDKGIYESRPHDYVLDNAKYKGLDVLASLKVSLKSPELIISADTVVYFRNKIYEKPKNEQHAFEILSEFAGCQHEVYTGVLLLRCFPDKEPIAKQFYEKSIVQFGQISSDLIKAYISTKEPMDKAGGYGIQDFGAALVEKIDGDYYNVEGFPYFRFVQELLNLYAH